MLSHLWILVISSVQNIRDKKDFKGGTKANGNRSYRHSSIGITGKHGWLLSQYYFNIFFIIILPFVHMLDSAAKELLYIIINYTLILFCSCDSPVWGGGSHVGLNSPDWKPSELKPWSGQGFEHALCTGIENIVPLKRCSGIDYIRNKR